jgi:hypothetical protein
MTLDKPLKGARITAGRRHNDRPNRTPFLDRESQVRLVRRQDRRRATPVPASSPSEGGPRPHFGGRWREAREVVQSTVPRSPIGPKRSFGKMRGTRCLYVGASGFGATGRSARVSRDRRRARTKAAVPWSPSEDPCTTYPIRPCLTPFNGRLDPRRSTASAADGQIEVPTAGGAVGTFS